MAKMGRPKVEEVKDKSINMRVTPAEFFSDAIFSSEELDFDIK